MGPVINRSISSFNSPWLVRPIPQRLIQDQEPRRPQQGAARSTFFASPLERTWLPFPEDDPSRAAALSLSLPSSALFPVKPPQNALRDHYFPVRLGADESKPA